MCSRRMLTKPQGWIRASSVTPKRQLPRRSSKDHSDAVGDEVMKFKQAGAGKEVFYPEWLANIVVVKKKSLCRLYGLEQSLSKRPLPFTLNRSIGRCNGKPSSDEFLKCFLRIPPNTISLRQSGEDNFCHPHRKLPLKGDVFWSK